ncbi:cation-transporting P-type ATPase [Clostridium niameyense]|uniref:P-type ATPase n=1 Tax=Clostridium niameyense TaxID=1622073 RepID=UPI00067EE636|nr:cation-transporting P-type ATPase [Clostridium niameyense]
MNNYYNRTWIDVVKSLHSNAYCGLTEDQVLMHRKKYGDNNINIPKRRSILYFIFNELKQFWVLSIILSSILFFILKDFVYLSIGVFILIIDIVIMVYLQNKEQKNIKTLENLNITSSRVLRGSLSKNINSTELVVGDIVRIRPGDIVPADIRIIESERIRVNEGVVTGEDYIVDKYATKIEDKEITTSEMKNILFKSSKVVSGEGIGIVIATGDNTEISNIISKFSEEEEEKVSLKMRIERIANVFSLAMFCILSIIFIVNYLENKSINDILSIIAVLMISYIPLTNIIIILLSKNIVLKKLRQEGQIFRNVSSMEKFSKTNIIFFNKLGSVSENSMMVNKIYTNGNFVPLNEETLKIEDEFREDLNVERILEIGTLCNDTDFRIGEGITNPKNDLIEIGLIQLAIKNNINKNTLEDEYNRILKIPYDRDKRIMTCINKVENNYRANIKGDLDSLLNKCTRIMKNGIEVEITEEDIQQIKMADMDMSKNSLFSIAFGYRSFNYEPSPKENIESNVVFVGIIGFQNPLREDLEQTFMLSRYLCVSPIMITEDNKFTAYHIGKKMGFIRDINQVTSGVEIDNMKEEEFSDMVEKIKVFSRINYKNKTKIAEEYKEKGYVTVMEASNSTDISVLKVADVGVTDDDNNLLKKFSDIVLKNKSLKQLLLCLSDCRRIMEVFKNIILYVMIAMLSTFLFSTIMCSYSNIYNFRHEILWINSITILISSLAMIIQYKDEEYDMTDYYINKNIFMENKTQIMITSILISAFSFLNFKIVSSYSININTAIVFSFLILNFLIDTLILGFASGNIFKNKASNILMIINMILPVILNIILYYDLTIKIFNLMYLKFLGITAVIWILILLFYKKEKNGALL